MTEINNASDYRTMMRVGMASPPYIPGILLAALARKMIGRKAINQKIVNDIRRDLNQTALLKKIGAPTLIVWGAVDQVEHVDNAELLRQELRDSRILLLNGVGHVPMVEAPKQVAAACRDFYTSCARC